MPSDLSSPSPAPPPGDAAASEVVGIILAGGAGRRMGAPSKPFTLLGGKPLIAHVIDRVRPQVSQLLVSANERAAFAGLGLPVLADPIPDLPGPLAGVLAGLDHIAQTAPGASLLSVPADAPFLPPDLAERLAARAATTGHPVCAASLGRRHPVIAVWPAAVRDVLRGHLERGERRVGLVLDLLGAGSLDWPAAETDPFFNVNTPEELEIARSRLTASS